MNGFSSESVLTMDNVAVRVSVELASTTGENRTVKSSKALGASSEAETVVV